MGYGRMRKIRDELVILILAVCSAAAFFADVEHTGNMSAALNGDGIPQLIGLCLIYYFYRRVWLKKELTSGVTARERLGYLMTAFLFTCFMVIGKAQTAREDLRYGIFAVLLFAGYMPLFYVTAVFLGQQLSKTADRGCGQEEPGRITRWLFEDHVIGSVMLVVFLCRLPYLIAFFPCSMAWDGGTQICYFYGSERFSDHHPPLLSFFYGAVAWYSDEWNIPNLGMFFIPLVQTTLSAFAAARVCALFRDFRIPYGIRWASLAYYGLFTVWCIFDVTVIKDSVYWPFTLLYAVSLARCVFEKEAFFSRKRNLLQMLLYALFMTQTRNNGIFVLLFTLPFAFITVARKKKALFAGAFAALLVLSYMINNILYPALGVIKVAYKEDMYSIMFQQTAKYVKDYPEDVTQEEKEFLDTLFFYDELADAYNPRIEDWVRDCLRVKEANSADGTNIEFGRYIDTYFRVWSAQFIRHPLSYINTFFECSYGYYYPEIRPYKEEMGFYEMDRNTFTNGMHRARQIPELARARFLLEQLCKLEFVPGTALLYRCGFYTWCVTFAFIYLVIKKRYRELVVTVPAVVNIMICVISPINPCTRYAMPTMCMIPLILGILYYKKQKNYV